MKMLMLMCAWCALWAAPAAKELEAVFAAYAKADEPGCAVGVMRGGAMVYQAAFGQADLERPVGLGVESRFYMASVSKQFTAAAALRAVAQGKLGLDDSVRKYVPEMPAHADGMTVRMLLHHTSGLRDYLALMGMRGWPDGMYTSDAEFLRLMGRQKGVNFAPGTKFLYSNSGYVLLSILVGRAVGKPFDVYAQEELFGPLGMKSTHFQVNRRVLIRNRAVGYSRYRQGWRADAATLDVVGDGGAFSTVGDMRLWDRFIGSEEGKRLWEKGRLQDGKELDYAFGLGHQKVMGEAVVGHGGALGGYRTYYGRFVDADLSVVCLCNRGDANAQRLAYEVAAKYLGKKLEAPAPVAAAKKEAKPVDPRPYAGRYFSEELDVTVELASKDGRLIYKTAYGEAEIPVVKAGEMGVVFEADGGMVINDPRAQGVRFRRVQ